MVSDNLGDESLALWRTDCTGWKRLTYCHKTLSSVWYRQKEESIWAAISQLTGLFWHCSVGFGGLFRQFTSPFPLLGQCFPFFISCCYPLPNLKGRAFLHLLLVPARIPTCAICSLPLIKLSLHIKQTNTKDCSRGRREEGRWSLSWPLEPSYVGNASFCSFQWRAVAHGSDYLLCTGLWPHPRHHIHKNKQAFLLPGRVAAHWVGCFVCRTHNRNCFCFLNAGHGTVALLLLHH